MTDESRKQAEAILNKTLEDNCFWLSDTEGNAIVKAMESYAALKVAEATKEMYPSDFVEWLILNEKFLPEIHRDIDNNVLAWGFGDYESNDIQTYTIEYVFEYWKQNIRK